MKQIICDKCGKKLIISKVRNKEIIDNLAEMLGGFGEGFFNNSIKDIPEFRTEIEGSIIYINLPKHKIKNKTYDLCEKCTKIFLENNIQKWLKEKSK